MQGASTAGKGAQGTPHVASLSPSSQSTPLTQPGAGGVVPGDRTDVLADPGRGAQGWGRGWGRPQLHLGRHPGAEWVGGSRAQGFYRRSRAPPSSLHLVQPVRAAPAPAPVLSGRSCPEHCSLHLGRCPGLCLHLGWAPVPAPAPPATALPAVCVLGSQQCVWGRQLNQCV